MRHAIGLGVLLLLVAPGDAHATGGGTPSCRFTSWIPTGKMTTPRRYHAATLLPDGKLLVSGGYGFATAELYDPASGTWSPTGSMSVPRQLHTMTLLPTGKVLVAGGFPDDRSAELYDPMTAQWTTTGAMVDPRAGHTATLLPTGEVLVVGGAAMFDDPPLASAEIYDPVTGQWHVTGTLSTGRLFHTATLLDSGQVLVLGGQLLTFIGGGGTPSAELYDPATGTWTPAAPMATGRYWHTATRLPSGAVLVAGGLGSSSGVPTEGELYDPAAGSWRPTGSLPSRFFEHTATRLPSGRVLVIGGDFLNTGLFDPGSEAWSDTGCANEFRGGHTATLLLSGAVLIAGGAPDDSSAELYGIVVSPTQVSLAPRASQTFTASKGSGFGYVWSFLENKSGGTLSAAGVYQAGSVGGVTDILQVVDSLANAATATVNVQRVGAAVSATSPQAKSMGCGVTDASAPPVLAGAVVLLVGWTSLTRRRGGRRAPP
jgi:hypothetical protein